MEQDPRTYFAAERTLLAWVRTGLALMGFGFVVAKFGLFLREVQGLGQTVPVQDNYGLSLWIGTGLVVLGVLANALSVVRYRSIVRRLNAGVWDGAGPSSLAIATALVLAAMGLLVAAYLLHSAR
jgi:putative membrane protein